MVNNCFRGNIQQPLPGALAAMPSNYWPRPPVIIPITSRTEESVTQHAGQGEGKATQRRINISFTHPALPSRARIKFTKCGGGERKGGISKRKETRSTDNNDTQPLISSGGGGGGLWRRCWWRSAGFVHVSVRRDAPARSSIRHNGGRKEGKRR